LAFPWPFLGRFRQNIPPAVSVMAGLFRPEGGHETNRGGHETISRAGEDVRKLAMVTNPANERRAAHWA
jgi:hypothetical protein